MRVLLIGSSGRVGQLVSQSFDLISSGGVELVRQSRSGNPSSSKNLNWDPSAGPEALLAWIEEFGSIDVFWMLAGVTGTQSSNLSQNAEIAEYILDAALIARPNRILLASSSAVYGFLSDAPYHESGECSPANLYGESKLLMEKVAESDKYADLEVSSLRIGNIAGADALVTNAKALACGECLSIDMFANGLGPLRSYIGPMRFTQVLISLSRATTRLPKVLNIADNSPIYMETLAKGLGYNWRYKACSNEHIQNITMDTERLDAILDDLGSACEQPSSVRDLKKLNAK